MIISIFLVSRKMVYDGVAATIATAAEKTIAKTAAAVTSTTEGNFFNRIDDPIDDIGK